MAVPINRDVTRNVYFENVYTLLTYGKIYGENIDRCLILFHYSEKTFLLTRRVHPIIKQLFILNKLVTISKLKFL